MKRPFLALCFLLFASSVHAQGTALPPVPAMKVVNGVTVYLAPIPNATITVCATSTLPQDGAMCSPLATIYSNATLTTAISNPTNADAYGNINSVYVAAGNYVVTISSSMRGVVSHSYAFTAPVFTEFPSWSSIAAPTANLTLQMYSGATEYASTFEYFGYATGFTWENIAPATSSSGSNSPPLALSGQYWNGSMSAADTWYLQGQIGTGTNAPSYLNISHGGSPNPGTVIVPGLIDASISPGTSPICPNGPSGTFTTSGCSGGGGGGGSSSWSALTAPTGNLALAMYSGSTQYTSSFQYGSSTVLAFNWNNVTAATSGAGVSSPYIGISGQYWTGSASAFDTWLFQDVPGNGANPYSELAITHNGSSGGGEVTVPNFIISSISPGTPPICANGPGGSLTTIGCSTASGVTSFTGDGTFANNSGSTGAVTLTIANTGVGYGVWGNTGSSSGAPAYHSMSSYPAAAFPTLNQSTTGNAATATNLASYPTLCSGGQVSQGLSSGSNNCTPGGGTINNAAQYATAYYSASGSNDVISGIANGITGQVYTATNGASPSFVSSGVADSANSPVTTSGYTLACDSGTTVIDRVHTVRFQSGGTGPIVPQVSASGCGVGFTTTVVDDGAGSITFTRSGSDTFSVFNGTTASDGQTTFGLTSGEYATLNAAAAGLWIVRITPAANGTTALSSLTNATVSNTLSNGNNPQTWKFAQTTSAQSAFLIQDMGSTGTNVVTFEVLGTVGGSGTTATALYIQGGDGPSGSNAPPGEQFFTGTGGPAATVTSAGNNGGIFAVSTNPGSNGGSTSGNGGAGGNIQFFTGHGGNATSGTSGQGGDMLLEPGNSGTGGTAGRPGQVDMFFGFLGGSNTSPFLNVTGTWNTTGVVDAAFLMNITNTASGAGSLLMDLQVGGSSQFSVDKGGNVSGTITQEQFIPAANCSNSTAGNGWSIGSGGTVTCRAGTNNLGGYIAITDTSSTFATFQIPIPEDWNTAQDPWIRFQIASTDATSAHTIIPEINVACYKGDGSTTDDVAPNGVHSLSTITLNGNANRFWSTSNVQMNSTDVTGCVAGALMQITVGRATDTATNAEFYGATITFPRKVADQAN